VIESFAKTGFAHVPSVLDASTCRSLCAQSPSKSGAGDRSLLHQPWCATLAASLREHPALSSLLAETPVIVQCTRFAKSDKHNWLVPLHQDLSIPVADRIDHPAWSGWSEKDGLLFAQPPVDVLEKMVAVRVHLDVCTRENGPLRVVSGSHRHGRLDVATARRLRDRIGETYCTADTGDAWVMRPLLLHASSKADGESHGQRRVLHFLFGPAILPHGFRWNPAA
jgi:hypothetical protein